MRDILGWTINLIIPALGLYAFYELWLRMKEEEVENPPTVYLFLLFATYGGWLMVFLTKWLWYWSGMASLGLAYLLLLAPFVTLIMAVMLFRQRKVSRYHKVAFLTSAGYTLVVGGFVNIALLYFRTLFTRGGN